LLLDVYDSGNGNLMLMLCSTITMWRALVHNNKYGPFVDHLRKRRGGETVSLKLKNGTRGA
jgi:hypothetical protein